jgi:hypothetical protein
MIVSLLDERLPAMYTPAFSLCFFARGLYSIQQTDRVDIILRRVVF